MLLGASFAMHAQELQRGLISYRYFQLKSSVMEMFTSARL